MNSSSLPVKHISDTAFLTALYRAIESDRADAQFFDPYARTLSGARGDHLTKVMPDAKLVAQGSAVRTCVMDELIMRTIQEDGVDTVLNLGAGLDARPYRLPLPASLRWVEADLSDVLAYKAGILADAQPKCTLELFPCDLNTSAARKALLSQVSAMTEKCLVVAEGLLVYMTPAQVADLASNLSAQQQIRWWLIDIASPGGLQQIQKNLFSSPVQADIKMQFAPEEGTNFFRAYGWQLVEFRSLFEEAQRLNRGAMPEACLAQLSSKQRKALQMLSGFALLTRAD